MLMIIHCCARLDKAEPKDNLAIFSEHEKHPPIKEVNTSAMSDASHGNMHGRHRGDSGAAKQNARR